ncbi:thioesterase II family protein [Streptomyces gamaensis]|uniref:Thioesterase II family protein n=1 Tax=Streptomyces gamaensis TaxID=1763542 RepID=A0ABW0ZBP7_9ACTN
MTRWFVGGRGGPAPLRLYCFAHSGGSPAEYVRWGRGLPGVELYAVQLPGRGSRIGEPQLTSMRDIVTALVEEAGFNGPYAFFGHSFGSLLAYETACALRAAGRELPRHLVVSSAPAPQLPRRHTGLHRLDDDALLTAVQERHGGIPREVFDHPEILQMAAENLRADYTVLETYTWRPRPPLPVPLTVLAGDSEPLSEDGGRRLAAWGELTTRGPVPVRTFPGGHFYLREQQGPLVQRTVAAALGTDVTVP